MEVFVEREDIVQSVAIGEMRKEASAGASTLLRRARSPLPRCAIPTLIGEAIENGTGRFGRGCVSPERLADNLGLRLFCQPHELSEARMGFLVQPNRKYH